jgi:uncharacterized protein
MSGDRGAFIWYELMTNEPDAAKAFYDAVIGWDIEPQGMPLPTGATYRMIRRSDGGHAGGVLGMSQDMLEHGGKPGWIGYIHTSDVDQAVEQVTGAGGTIHMPAMDMPGVGRMAMAADPWGATFYLMTPTPPADDLGAKSDVYDYAKPQHVRWNELWATDQKGAVAFYADLFGWRQEGAMPMGPMGDYLFLQRGEGMFGAVGQAQPGGEGSRWQYFIDRAGEAVTAGGGTLLGDPQEIPGGDYSVYAHDPQGATFGLVGPRKE